MTRHHTLNVETGLHQVTDLTEEIEAFLEPGDDGLLTVFVPHATAGVAIIETGSGTEYDLALALAAMLPRDDRWRHRHGARGHGADHVLPAIIAPSTTIPVRAGRLRLGTWQRVTLVDLNVDNPRRQVHLALLQG